MWCVSWCWVFLITVNECATNNGGCAHTCTDTVGSFTCSCRTGFVLASNGLGCNGEEGREGRREGRERQGLSEQGREGPKEQRVMMGEMYRLLA